MLQQVDSLTIVHGAQQQATTHLHSVTRRAACSAAAKTCARRLQVVTSTATHSGLVTLTFSSLNRCGMSAVAWTTFLLILCFYDFSFSSYGQKKN